MQSDLLIYKDDNGNVAIDVRLEDETVWLSQVQMAELFGKGRTTITEHIRNIFRESELVEEMVCRKFRHTSKHGAIKGKTQKSEVLYYNLDVIISVGYRVKSQQGTQFRIWATSRLKDYLIKGYAINQQRLLQNSQELQQALALIQKTANSSELTVESGRGLVDIVSRYTQTFLWLQQYDEGLLTEPKTQLGGELPSVEQARIGLSELKQQLISRGEASELFGRERDDGLSAILGNLSQSVFGEPAYPSIEEKAAHLLYFIVKNHPFSDGNKRSGAFLFVDFLHRNNRLFNTDGNVVINDTGLAALTLLVAESDPKQKETLIKLIIHMLKK
ncbi:virulence protein RhuM/Fic/DOC family protein [Phocoenobacter atlanticus]|uniref:virulence protein RhuM/Fic/DOC family protein n=1 Tax=Phocoenobacter atlanticus TaxID=3416742 RepID=UPI002777A3AA|nr:virulence protein RhuM/Fic/DOC family protein [Pasteurella atlantica]MDP8102029.1 virulence protein RhuM/Fic/DOC family protein [Pasteurella atlantica]